MKKLVFLLFIFLTNILFAEGITFNGTARNSVYGYQSEDSHTRMYQYLKFNVLSSCKKFSVSSSMRALTDFNETLDNDMRYKIYSLKFDAKNLIDNRLRLTLGRQFLHPGTVLGALDGVNASFKILSPLSIQLYGGVESHFNKSIQVYEPDQSTVFGGTINLSQIFSTRLQALYLHKRTSDDVYWHLAGVNLANNSYSKLYLKLQTHYDLENSRMHRLLASARMNVTDDLITTVEFKNQHPQIYANSYFTIFQPDAYKKYKLAAAYRVLGDYFVEARYQTVSFEDDAANQIYFQLQNDNGGLGFVYESGFAGDQLGLVFDYAYAVTPKILASVYIDYSKYRTEEIYEYDNLLSNAVRCSYKFNKHLKIDVEYQWLTNRYYSQDSRFLNHISYIW